MASNGHSRYDTGRRSPTVLYAATLHPHPPRHFLPTTRRQLLRVTDKMKDGGPVVVPTSQRRGASAAPSLNLCFLLWLSRCLRCVRVSLSLSPRPQCPCATVTLEAGDSSMARKGGRRNSLQLRRDRAPLNSEGPALHHGYTGTALTQSGRHRRLVHSPKSVPGARHARDPRHNILHI